MKTLITPGKFKQDGLYIDAEDGSLVATIHLEDSRENEAVGRLFTASPTMLKALEKAKSTIEYFNHGDTKYATAYHDICEAIKEATELL